MTAVDLATLTLSRGGHNSRDEGVCATEAVAWLANEPHSDHPECLCPVLGAFLRRFNDGTDDEGREALKPFLPRVIGTAGDGHQRARGFMAADWATHVALPAWLELAGAGEAAAKVRAVGPITDDASAQAAREVTRPLYDELWERRQAALKVLREKVKAAVIKALGEKRHAAAVAVAVAVAAAAAAAAAVADAAAAAVADAAAAAAAAADADADAAAAADAVADAAAAAAAAADADAAAAAAAAADADADAGWKIRSRVYDAVKQAVQPKIEEKVASVAAPLKASGLELLERMVALGEDERKAKAA